MLPAMKADSYTFCIELNPAPCAILGEVTTQLVSSNCFWYKSSKLKAFRFFVISVPFLSDLFSIYRTFGPRVSHFGPIMGSFWHKCICVDT